MAFIDTYFKEVEQRFAVMKQEREPLERAARLLFEAEKEHHTIYTFGSGHSHMIGQDIYARAGGYAKVYPINEIEMTLATTRQRVPHWSGQLPMRMYWMQFTR